MSHPPLRPDRRALLKGGVLAGAAGALPAGAHAKAKPAHNGDPDPFVLAPLPPQAPAREFKLPVADGVSLWGWDTGGHGTPVVLFHSRTGSGQVWAYQQPALAKAGYRVIGYSRRGFAGSDGGPKERPGTGSGDLQALLDALKIGKFHAVSTAAGGFVAADYALSHGERLLSLTLACSILGVSDDQIGVMNKALRQDFFNALPPDFQELGPSYRAADPQGHALWVQLHGASQVPGAVEQPLANAITLAALKTIKARTLLICGDSDLIAPPPIMRAFAKAMPGSTLEVITEAGHSAYWERPAQFNRAVIGFMEARSA